MEQLLLNLQAQKQSSPIVQNSGFTQLEREQARGIVKQLYKDEEGNPIILKDGQCDIFLSIFKRKYPRNHLMTYTRYGKSFVVALAVLTRICTYPEKWSVVAGRAKQASIIMDYIIQHAFDNEFTRSKLEIPKGESLEHLKRERSKERLTFKHPDGLMGEVFILSADSRNKQTAGEAVMGFGSCNVILDEAALIDDDIEAKIFRMLGDMPDNFYLKIGNPFRRNHFYKDFTDKNFFHININFEQGIKEGRITQEFINEAYKKPLFNILYENVFPAADMINDKGYVPLINESDLIIIPPQDFVGKLRMGIDPAGEGNDETIWVVRDRFKARVVGREAISKPSGIAAKTMTLMTLLKIPQEEIDVDAFGEGFKTVHELSKEGIIVNAHNVGDPCEDIEDEEIYLNKRAMAYWALREWLKKGCMLMDGGDWAELLDIMFKAQARRKIQIIGKAELLKNGIVSPNTADALMLTFIRKESDYLTEAQEREERDEVFDRFAGV